MLTKKKQLWAPFLSTVLQRRTFHSTARRFLPQIHSYSSSAITNSRCSKNHHFLENPLNYFSRKNFFSSEPSGYTHSCWNCNAQPQQQSLFLVCESCRAIQPVDQSIDYFQILGLEKKYEIKEGENLERKYKDWQKLLHPDLVHSKSQKEREFAAEQSARVIDAYRTLSNPRLRAIYILKLEGVDVNEEETISEPHLLAEIMEIREAVEEAPDSKALSAIQSLMREKLLNWSNSFGNAFERRKFEDAIACIRRMTYYDRVNEEIVKRL
ncbi:iron-sulfur cluster co-chaperone protein HscB homolog [Mercurialis annua]|uniref:iron-sulfur cluster co-chaperone protein HscB homolog n=1 Tax=Mercurialis annua TaxID=3986 RepID=UPI00215F9239|nr:iron-sulfur cluster co-chaperone protein HscB homolog [Mercurialis annua]